MRLNWGTAPVGPFEIFQVLLVVICLVLAFIRPAAGSQWFARIEAAAKRLSARPWLSAILLFTFPIAVRLILLPVYGPPAPLISDEYAYLLQADTFSAGRWTNPAPPQPQQFASVYVLAQPTYTAEYQPAQGLSLAAGQRLTGRPWVGVVLGMGVLCALVYWALLAWLPPAWAFFGTALVLDIEIGVLSYWMNSYWGGAIPAIGGTLALGGLARLPRKPSVFHTLVTATGLILLMNSRPLEGLFLTLVIAGALVYWAVSGQIALVKVLSRIVPALACSAALAIAFSAYYNRQVTGKATEFPYLLYRAGYGMPQGFFWQKPVTVDTAAMPSDIRAEYEDQLRQHERRTSLKALVGATGGKLRRFWEFYIGIPLTVTLVFLPFVWREPNMRLVSWALAAVLLVDNLLFFAYFPHYSAAVIALVVLVIVQCLRHMRRAGPAGLFLARSLPLVCLLGLLVPVLGRLAEGALPGRLRAARRLWQSEFLHDISREHFLPQLEQVPGKQLVFVHYLPYRGQKKFEWIYNGADLDSQKIIWARDGDPALDEKLCARFPGRQAWLAEPDATPPRLSPYPGMPSHLSQ